MAGSPVLGISPFFSSISLHHVESEEFHRNYGIFLLNDA